MRLQHDAYQEPGGFVTQSYSAGIITGPSDSGCSDLSTGDCVGGFIGFAYEANCCAGDAWDTDPNGVPQQLTAGGNMDLPGVDDAPDSTLRCTESPCTLPPGFDSAWGVDQNVNGGLPYLISNPPS